MTASILDNDIQTGTTATSVTSKSMSWSSGDVVIVYSNGRDSTDNVSSVTTTGSGLSFSAQEANTTQSRTQGGFYTAVASASSSGTITVNYTAAMDSCQAHFVIVQDADTIEDSAVASGASTAPSTSVTPTSSDTLVLGFAGVSQVSPTWTEGSGYTSLYNGQTSGVGGNLNSASSEYKTETSTSPVTVNYTISASANWVMFAIAIGTAAAGGVTPRPTVLRSDQPYAVIAAHGMGGYKQ